MPLGLRAAVDAKLAEGPEPDPVKPKELNQLTPLEDRRFVVGYRGTDEFLESVKGTGLDTVKWVYGWTKDRKKVKRLSWKDLANGLMMNLTCGYGGSVFVKRVK